MNCLEPQILVNNSANQIGLSSTLAKHGDLQLIFPHYEEIFMHKAMEFTQKALLEFENPSHITRNDAIFATSQWFLSLEYFISKLALIAYFENHNYTFENEKNFYKEYKNKNIYAKIHTICENLNLDKLLFKKSELQKRILELGYYRNALFHAGIYSGQDFSNNPISITAEHMIYVMDIFISTVNMFRGVLFSIDITPQYPLVYKSNAKFFDISTIYYEVILPSFFEISKKHNISLHFNKIENNFSYSRDASNNMYLIFIQAEHNNDSLLRFSSQKTQILNSRINMFFQKNFPINIKDCIYFPNCLKNKKIYDVS